MSTLITMHDGVFQTFGQKYDVSGMQFNLVKHFRVGASGGYIKVDGGSVNPPNPVFPDREIKIKCDSADSYVVEFTDEDESTDTIMAHRPVITETDDEIIERLRVRFDILKDMTGAVKAGNISSLIVTGPPGVGKSFGVDEVLSKDDLFDTLAQRKPKYEFLKGSISALGLYAKLYEYSTKGHILILDDIDCIYTDPTSLNILKAALDTSKKRYIAWHSDSRMLRVEGIPDKFEFRGGVIFITNIQFGDIRSKKLQAHLEALESRSHHIDLQMQTRREKLLRIRQIVADGMLHDYYFSDEQQNEVVNFVIDNADKLRELSLRTVIKVADLCKSFQTTWKDVANITIMK
jgi:hypothetical protein